MLDITPFENNVSEECCKEDLKDDEGGLVLLENVFDEASNLNEKERSVEYSSSCMHCKPAFIRIHKTWCPGAD